MADANKQFTIRVEGNANRFGLGEVVVPGVAFFRKDRYNLTKDELQAALAQESSRRAIEIV